MRAALLLTLIQTWQYFLLTINHRAIAQAKYFWTGVSDLVYAAGTFWLIKTVARSDSTLAWVGYTLGGVIGAQVGIYFTRHWRQNPNDNDK